MIKQFIKFSTLSLAIVLGLGSCDGFDNVDPISKGDYESGYFVSNEGNFGSPNASITFMANDMIEPSHNIFSSSNGNNLGDVLQSVAFDDDYAYLVVNNSNKIEVVDRYTFKSVATITDNLKSPRYAVTHDKKLYVTNSGENSVEVFDTNSFTYLTTIAIDKTVEEIIEENDFLYVMNAAWGTGNTISVIDTKSNTAVKTITVGEGLNSMAIEEGILYALHNTGITKVNTSNNEVMGDLYFEDGLSNASKLVVEDEFIYFLSESKIFKFNKDVTTLTNTELIDTQTADQAWFLGYGFNVIDEKLFYTDVKGFTENSEVKVYDLSGKLLKTFTAGIGANGVYDNH